MWGRTESYFMKRLTPLFLLTDLRPVSLLQKTCQNFYFMQTCGWCTPLWERLKLVFQTWCENVKKSVKWKLFIFRIKLKIQLQLNHLWVCSLVLIIQHVWMKKCMYHTAGTRYVCLCEFICMYVILFLKKWIFLQMENYKNLYPYFTKI